MTRNCGGVVSPAPYTTQSLDTGMCPGLDIIYRYLDIIYRYLDIVTMNGSSDDCCLLRWSGGHYLVVIRAVHEPSRSFTQCLEKACDGRLSGSLLTESPAVYDLC